MKTTAWILLFLNIGLLVYFNLDRILPNAPTIQWAEISPEKISLLTEAQISKLPKLSLIHIYIHVCVFRVACQRSQIPIIVSFTVVFGIRGRAISQLV